jgi:nucleotide-binding universal stress UspA family protein
MIKNILVATDGSTAANRAVDLAADMAVKYECSLTILNVVRDMQLPPELVKMAEVENLSLRDGGLLKFLAEKVLNKAAERAKKKGAKEVRTAVVQGDPATAIIKQAKRRNADLIIMGTRGLGKVKEAFLGSVSRKVCNLSQMNCLTVK